MKSKEGFKAGPTFSIHDHAINPIMNLLRMKPGDNEAIYEAAENAYMVEIEKAGDSTDSNAYIKDDRGLIHKFKLNMKTCVGHAMSKKENEEKAEETKGYHVFESDQENEIEETEAASNTPVKRGGRSRKILTERNVRHGGSVKSGVVVGTRRKASTLMEWLKQRQ